MYTYQWYKGCKKIEGATEKTLEVTKDGEYTVDVVAHDGKNESAAATSNSITLAFEKHDVMLAFAHGEVERHANEIGGTFTIGLTIQVCAFGAVVYASDNEDVATVDPVTGEVTIKGVGEAVITAKIAETDTHEAAEASYKLTVTDHDSGTWQTVKEPTCTEVGSEQRVCEVCGEVLETREIAAKGNKDASGSSQSRPPAPSRARRSCTAPPAASSSSTPRASSRPTRTRSPYRRSATSSSRSSRSPRPSTRRASRPITGARCAVSSTGTPRGRRRSSTPMTLLWKSSRR